MPGGGRRQADLLRRKRSGGQLSLIHIFPIPLEEKDNFKLTKEKLLSYITPKSKILVLPFPNNPTGAVMTAEELAVIAEIVIEKDLFVLTRCV